MRDEALATGIRCPDYFPCGLFRMDLVPGYLDEGRGRDASPDLHEFHPEVFMQFVSGYKGVFALMVIGYVLHFMPKRSEDVLREIVTRSPLLIQAAILAIAIFIVVQFKSAGVQPFIYFQF